MIQQLQQQVQHFQQANQILEQKIQAKVIDNAAKERLQLLKNHGDLQIKKLDLTEALIDAQSAKDSADAQAKSEAIKMNLNHIQHHQKLAIDMLKHHDKMHGVNDQPQYEMMERSVA
jgi:DNA-binding protein YbaB